MHSEIEAAKEKAAAEQQAFQDSLAEGTAREEGLAAQIAELQSAVAALEASLGNFHTFAFPSQKFLETLYCAFSSALR